MKRNAEAMRDKKLAADALPENFTTLEEFWEFWDSHSSADYEDAMEAVEVEIDQPYPSCLMYGESFTGEPIHSVWAYNPETQWAVLITVYRPDPERWVNWRTRKKK
jgi:hypothetical protein